MLTLAVVGMLLCLVTAKPHVRNVDEGDSVIVKRSYSGFSSPLSGEIQVCMDCDKPCFDKLGNTAQVTSYINSVLSSASQIYQDNDIDINFVLEHFEDYHIGDVSLMSTYHANEGNHGYKANSYYWNTGNDNNGKFKKRRGQDGCDVAFLITDDYFFTETNTVGYAMKSSMCSDYSFGILEIQKNNIPMAASTFAHETGHLFGMYHDGESGHKYKSADVVSYCSSSNYCQDCVMSAALGSTPSTEFSDCSLAQFKEWVTGNGNGNTMPACIGRKDHGTGGSGEEEE